MSVHRFFRKLPALLLACGVWQSCAVTRSSGDPDLNAVVDGNEISEEETEPTESSNSSQSQSGDLQNTDTENFADETNFDQDAEDEFQELVQDNVALEPEPQTFPTQQVPQNVPQVNAQVAQQSQLLPPNPEPPSQQIPQNMAPAPSESQVSAPVVGAMPSAQDLLPTNAELWWVGYDYKPGDKQVNIEILTRGRPRYDVLQELNRRGQPEIVVRLHETSLLRSIRRDIDASEFRSPVAFVRMRPNAAENFTDVVLTMRDVVKPTLFAKAGNIRLTFPVPARYLGAQATGEEQEATESLEPIARAEDLAKANILPTIEPSSDQPSPRKNVNAAAPYPNPGSMPQVSQAIPAAGLGGNGVVMPATDAPANGNPAGGAFDLLEPVLQSDPGDSFPIEELPANGQGQQSDMFNQNGAQATPASGESPIRLVSFGIIGGVAQDDMFGATDQIGVDTESIGEQSFSGRPVRLDFRGAKLAEVIRALAAESNLNFVFPPSFEDTTIDLTLNNVPWDEALRVVLEVNQLGMVQQGSVILIDRLKNITANKQQVQQARVAAARLQPKKVLVLRLSYAKAEDMKKTLTTMLQQAADAQQVASEFRIESDTRTNSLVIEAIPNDLSKIKALVERLDLQTPQVEITSRIIEVQKKVSDLFGIAWSGLLNYDQGRGLGFGTLQFPNSYSSRYSIDAGPTTPTVGAANVRFGSINSAFDLDLRINMEVRRGTTEVLESSKVIVQDNFEANIESGRTDFFIPLGDTIVTGSGAQAQQGLLEVEQKLRLKVTPRITADGSVDMTLEVAGDTPQNVSGSAVASSLTRLVKTKLLRRSGETAVIGGVQKMTKTKSQAGVPFLSDIPIVGALFRRSDSSEDQGELLIMVTPRILSSGRGAANMGTSDEAALTGSTSLVNPVSPPTAMNVAPLNQVPMNQVPMNQVPLNQAPLNQAPQNQQSNFQQNAQSNNAEANFNDSQQSDTIPANEQVPNNQGEQGNQEEVL